MKDLRKVERAAGKVAVARDQLEAAICVAHSNGHSLRKIAQAAGLSHERVRVIVSL